MLALLNSERIRLRALESLQTRHLLADYAKVHWSFKPTHNHTTERVHVSSAWGDCAQLLGKPKFCDTRAGRGDDVAIDRVIHLWTMPFKKTVFIL